MTIINDTTIVVFTYAELKSVLESDNTYTYIYFGANIYLEGGIKIASTKTTLTIDGTYEGITYTYEDNKSLSASNTIYVNNANNQNITVKNLNVTGNNYYGIIYVPEATTYNNVTTSYDNITYVGPQMIFNPNGTTIITNSNITVGDSSLVTGNEVAECNKLKLGGNTTILHKSASNSPFWFRNDTPTLTILENANVTFTSENRELFYGTNNLTFNILENATFKVTTKTTLGYNNFGTGITTINKNASFIFTTTANNGTYALWYSYNKINMLEKSTLNIICNNASLNASNYNIYFQTSSSGLVLTSPKEVILSNTKANVINTNATSTFDFTIPRINLFNTIISLSDPISESTLPTYAWYKENDALKLSGTFTSSTTTTTTNNLTTEEQSLLPSLTNLLLQNKKIISIGTTNLEIKPITDEDLNLTGTTNSLASTLINFDTTNQVALSDTSGKFTLPLENTLPIGTIITFTTKENNKPIYVTKKSTVLYHGDLLIKNIPESIEFNLIPLTTNPPICEKTTDLTIEITDTRIHKAPWYLYASINNDLTSNNNILTKSLIYNNNILSKEKTLIYEKNNDYEETTTITQKKNEGILLQINNPVVNKNTYSTKIIWTLET